jgi:hypothetical protein
MLSEEMGLGTIQIHRRASRHRCHASPEQRRVVLESIARQSAIIGVELAISQGLTSGRQQRTKDKQRGQNDRTT